MTGKVAPIYAVFWRRVAAGLIDVVIFLVLIFGLLILSDYLPLPGYFLLYALTSLSYSGGNAVCLAKFGMTPGKYFAGLKVVRVDHGDIGWKEALIRSGPDFIFAAAYYGAMLFVVSQVGTEDFSALDWIGREDALETQLPLFLRAMKRTQNLWTMSEFVAMFTNEKRRALHDLLAGTVVVKRSLLEAKAGIPE